MPKVSSKRQITIPIDQCRCLGIEPGDKVKSLVVVTLVKKSKRSYQWGRHCFSDRCGLS